MANAYFDTLTTSKDLQQAGIETRHAEAIALAIKDSHGELATKADIEQLRSEIVWVKWSMALMMAIMLGGFSAIIAMLS